MPFHIVKEKRGFRVQDDKGNFYSKKPLTKQRATAQLRALYASYSRGESLRGKGYATYCDDDGTHHLLLQGEGFFSDIWTKIKQVTNTVASKLKPIGQTISTLATPENLQRVSDVLATGVREDYPPDVRKVLEQYGNGDVYNLVIYREPIQQYIDTILNIISVGQWNQAKQRLNYDKMFHLSMVASIAMRTGDKVQLKIEKNEVINITPNFSISPTAESIQVPVQCCITLNQMLKKAQDQQGPKFFKYDAFTNNCQMFLMSILDANNLSNPPIVAFVSQNAEGLVQQLPEHIPAVASTLTNLAGFWNRLVKGRGEFDAKGRLEGGRIYCGKRERVPARYERKGTTGECFKKGVGVGMMLERQKQPAEKALEDMTIRELGQLASKLKVSGYSKMKKAELLDAIRPLRGGAIGKVNPDGSWSGDRDSWFQAGNPGCGPNSYYDKGGPCFENCAEEGEPFVCKADLSQRKQNESTYNRLKDNAQVRTATQDNDSMKQWMAINNIQQDEQNAKQSVVKDSTIPPVPPLDTIPLWTDIPSDYTGFAKSDSSPNETPNIIYYNNGKVMLTGISPNYEGNKYEYNWDTVRQRWERLQSIDSSRPGNFLTKDKNGRTITTDSQGREAFDIGKHGTVEWLNSVEGRHIREADPYFEELFQRLKDEPQNKKSDAQLEEDYQKELRQRYGDSEEIYSPEANFTLTDKQGNKRRVNKVRLREDGGYDIQFDNGTWEYQPGKDEWDCNEWKRGDRIENYGVCGTEERKKASERIKANIDNERDQQWNNMSGWDKFVNGLNVAGSFTQDYIIPVASTALQFVPGFGQVASTALDVAGQVAGALTDGQCRHFNECTEQQKAEAEANALYHRTKGDTVAEQYLTDENWQKILEPNKSVYGLIRDTAQYGSRAGKFYATGSGKLHQMKQNLRKNAVPPTHQPPMRHPTMVIEEIEVKPLTGGKPFYISPPFRKHLKAEGVLPEKYLHIVREIANEQGYDGRALEFSDDDEHKLMIYDDKGTPRRFGRVGYGDFILWSIKEAKGNVPKGFAEQKRRVFNKSHSKIKGDWEKDKFSPNNLALHILW